MQAQEVVEVDAVARGHDLGQVHQQVDDDEVLGDRGHIEIHS